MTEPTPVPLAGIKIVEFEPELAGPIGGQILAYLARMRKVERRRATMRARGPAFPRRDALGFIALQQRQEVDHRRSRRQR